MADATSYKAQRSLNRIMGQKGQTASLRGGLAFATTIHPYDGSMSEAEAGYETGTSIFDPVLCELAYRWFCPSGGVVLDPFAGGSVRGIVASKLGLCYVGIDLSERQIIANREQAAMICDNQPDWRVGDSTQIVNIAADVDADFILSCPPYADLEQYSEDPRDISTLSYAEFVKAYRIIIAGAVSRLKQDRFACFVVGDVRGKDGYYYGLPSDTISAFVAAGARLYNQAILVTATGSLPIRAGRAFSSNRKLGNTHQQVLFFCKGDWAKAAKACADVE